MAETFAERELKPLGFEIVDRHETKNFITDSLTMKLGEAIVKFECVCPAFPTIKALGCALHHEGPGGSWPVTQAKEIA